MEYETGIDWGKVKHWYVTHPGATYKSTAARYRLNERTVRNKGSAEGWKKEQTKFRKKRDKKATEKSLAAAARQATATQEKFYAAGLMALDKIYASLEQVDPTDREGLRKSIVSLRDLREILTIRNERELREIDARIAILEKTAEQGAESDGGLKMEIVPMEGVKYDTSWSG